MDVHDDPAQPGGPAQMPGIDAVAGQVITRQRPQKAGVIFSR